MKSLVLVVAGGLAGFLTATMAVSERATPSPDAGPWMMIVNAASEDVDPYMRAHYAGTGRLLPMQGEDALFQAETDNAGRSLDGDCSYLVSGVPPAVRWWQIAAVGDAASAAEDPHPRPDVMTSRRLIGEADGGYRLTVAREPKPGNWIAPSDDGAFKLVMMLHEDAPVHGPMPLPSIERLACG